MDNLALLQWIIYSIFLLSIIAYVTLDGFDLGVGCLHLFARGDNERRLMINAIGPVWDGNTTWIVIGGGVLFAGFPRAFSEIFSSLYTPTMLLIFGFMVRAAAIEFRSKKPSYTWRYFWDGAFFFASLLLAFTVGLTLGNMIEGIPLTAEGRLENGMLSLLHPYPLLVACFGISTFTMHGSIYLLMKTEGQIHNRIRRWAYRCIAIFLILWTVTTLSTFFYVPHMISRILHYPALLIFPFLSLISILAIPKAISQKKDGWAFIASCSTIFFLMILFVIGTVPYIARSLYNPEDFTLYNSSASLKALTVLTIVSLSALPLTYFYLSYIYKVFKGKVKLDHMSY